MNSETIEALEGKIGYTFRDRSLLVLALTHTSFANEAHSGHLGSNERLEFLGDAVLELVSSDFFYREKPKLSEGELTKLRASFVCEPALAYCAEQIPLPPYLLLGRGEEMTGGRLRPSIVSDAMEAVIGAIYLDGGLTPARAYIDRFILNDIEGKRYFYDAKTILQEEIQKDKDAVLSYELRGEEGPEHLKRFTVAALRDGVPLAEGEGSSKKEAEQRAAYAALLALGIAEGGTCT
ncbi:ribonuclease III [Stomatobaculum longum]|uniref:Ribonuclease 3 n=2 Tax=Stomatobaculum longum TaxID=796942 RepID=A0AA37DH97_9FIRM|nr:ribonuclease III [Stomatobaculum longum]EHO18618.1 ribonuclease III [Stomatobaculum longum]